MPLTVTFPVSNPIAFHLPLLDLPAFTHEITVSFEDGTHVFTSLEFKLGTAHGHGQRAILGRLVFRYTYDSTTNAITVCATDYPSADGMALITHPEGSEPEEDTCIEHAENTGFPADELHGRRSWNYHTQLMPGAAQAIKAIVRGANEALISTLESTTTVEPEEAAAAGIIPTAVYIRSLPPVLPLDTYLSLTHVHRDGEFLELYNPDKIYLPGDHISPVDSVRSGTVTLKWEEFANVIGSTKDPKVPSGKGKPYYYSWIGLWNYAMGMQAKMCTSDGYDQKFQCGDKLVGGHVIAGPTAKRVKKGANNVWISPICKQQNGTDEETMGAVKYTRAVTLKNYWARLDGNTS